MTTPISNNKTAKDYATDQDVRWCPGCGDYSILKQVQTVLADEGLNNEDIVFISGIGCSSRFPYYMNTYGIHSIHGRAPALVSGLKAVRPDLSVWMITGDGDSLSIGGNHLIHILRRNFDVNILLFNNEIYGLTKGQYSPTSPSGQISKSTPMGSIDHPFNPLALCMGADATFVARAMDRDPIQLRTVLAEANKHKGTSLVEVYQNCNVFNDGAFFVYTEKSSKPQSTLFVEHGQPLVFGENKDKGIKLDGFKPVVVDLNDPNVSMDDLWIHDQYDKMKATLLTRIFEDNKGDNTELPRPFGIFYQQDRYLYEDSLEEQIQLAKKLKGEGDLDSILAGSNTWKIN